LKLALSHVKELTAEMQQIREELLEDTKEEYEIEEIIEIQNGLIEEKMGLWLTKGSEMAKTLRDIQGGIGNRKYSYHGTQIILHIEKKFEEMMHRELRQTESKLQYLKNYIRSGGNLSISQSDRWSVAYLYQSIKSGAREIHSKLPSIKNIMNGTRSDRKLDIGPIYDLLYISTAGRDQFLFKDNASWWYLMQSVTILVDYVLTYGFISAPTSNGDRNNKSVRIFPKENLETTTDLLVDVTEILQDIFMTDRLPSDLLYYLIEVSTDQEEVLAKIRKMDAAFQSYRNDLFITIG
jgi:hypothetical protein